RIHTSAATVAVMPEVDAGNAVEINPSEVRVDTFRASGAGGQHVNKTDSAVRLVHAPTGIVVECQDARSQHKNREQARRILAARIKDKQTSEETENEAAEKKSRVGTGARVDRGQPDAPPQRERGCADGHAGGTARHGATGGVPAEPARVLRARLRARFGGPDTATGNRDAGGGGARAHGAARQLRGPGHG